jgi:HEPN domain-containing protein
MLTSSELRKLIKAHNILSKIVIPKGSSKDDLIKLIEKAGYTVDEEKKVIRAKVKRGKQITLAKAEDITKKKPAKPKKPITRQDKKKEMEKVIQYILKNKSLLKDERIKSLL